jgi:hypothetical protein
MNKKNRIVSANGALLTIAFALLVSKACRPLISAGRR